MDNACPASLATTPSTANAYFAQAHASSATTPHIALPAKTTSTCRPTSVCQLAPTIRYPMALSAMCVLQTVRNVTWRQVGVRSVWLACFNLRDIVCKFVHSPMLLILIKPFV